MIIKNDNKILRDTGTGISKYLAQRISVKMLEV